MHASYIIDGAYMEFTPDQLLAAVTEGGGAGAVPSGGARSIVDETLDPRAKSIDFDSGDVGEYLRAVQSVTRRVPLDCCESYTRTRLASALIDAIWKKGSFRLGDLYLDASWRWDESPVGAMAAFYGSVSAAADYVDALGLRFRSYAYAPVGQGPAVCGPSVDFGVVAADPDPDADESLLGPFRTASPSISDVRACASVLEADPHSWVVYIPFDPADFRLGGSLLAQALGLGGSASNCRDADYFVDCYEVVREFVEDGILLSGVTVSDGGLFAAASRMTSPETGLSLDVSGILGSYQEKSLVRVLFSEVPGVLLQIRDSDFDYLDAELLLQDVAYFPLGHPDPGCAGVQVRASRKSGIQTILESLMLNAEGED